MTTREDTHGCDYFMSIFLLPQLCNSTGKYTGRPKALSDEQVADARRRIKAGESKTLVAKALDVGRSTLYRYL